MKKILFFMLVVATIGTVNAQSEKYESAMKTNLGLLKNAKSSMEYLNVANSFERIANAEKNQWLPYYYAAFAQVQMGMNDAKADKDAIGKKVDELLASGEAINENAEFMALHYLNETMEMIVNPQQRWQTNGAAMEKYYLKGIALDPDNPRLYFLKGENIMHTPDNFGGGKQKAKPLFSKAVELFEKAKPESSIYPTWGKETAQKMLVLCDQ